MGRARAAMIENNIDSLTKKLRESEQKLKDLRNLKLETESKLLVENAWQRYIRDQIAMLKRVESTKSVLTNTEK
jgi:trans-aconitate methyltransferase